MLLTQRITMFTVEQHSDFFMLGVSLHTTIVGKMKFGNTAEDITRLEFGKYSMK